MAGISIAILLEGVLHVGFTPASYDASFCLRAGAGSLGCANDAMELAAAEHGTGMKQLLETQSCLEEISIRIFSVQPDSEIQARIQFGNAISVRLSWLGQKYNPLYIGPGEDKVDVAGLKIIKHRALRASFSRRGAENRLHIVI